MRGEALRVLLVDDEASLRRPLARYLSDTYGYQVDTAADGEETWERVLQAERPYDVALIDNLLPPEPGAEPEPIGIDLMRRIKERCPETEVIIFTGGGMERALEALRAGAYRYLAKPLNLDELGITILMAAEQARLRQERDLLSAALGISRAMISGLDIGKTLEVIAEAVPKLAGAEAYAVARITPATGQVRYEPVVLLGDKAVRWCRHLRDVELTRQIIESGETFTLPDMDARTDEVEVDENLCRAGVKSFIGVPISGEPQNLGVLYAYSTRREAFGTREQQVLQLLADQAGIAIANAQAFAKLEEHAGHMEALVQAGQGLTKTTRVEDQLSLAWEFVQEQLKVATFFVALYDKRADVLRFPLFYDKGRPIQVTDLRLGDDPERWGITGYVVKTGQELYWPTEESSRAQCRSLGIERFQIGKPCQSCFFLPLKLGDKVVGSISVQSYNKHAFTPTLLNACRALGSQLSEALGNARLFSELVEAKEWQEALIENAFDAVIAIDQNKRITVFNQRAEEMFGWRAREMIGQTVVRLHMDVGKAKEIWDVVSREGAVSDWEVMKHRDGDPIPALLSATLIRDSGGHPIGQAGFIRDLRRVNLLEERLRALIWVSQAITSTLELDEVLDQVIQAALIAFPAAQHGTIHLYDELTQVLCLKANTYGYSPAAVEALRLRPGEGIAGWVFQHRQPVIVDDAHQDPRHKWVDYPEVSAHKSMVCVPLEVREQVIGTLSLNTQDVLGVFRAEDLELFCTFAEHAAIAIDNARLYQEARRRQQLLTALDEASRHIRAEKETPKLLQEIVRLAAELVGCTTGGLYLNNPHQGELELFVTYGLPVELTGSRLPHAEGLVGLVARTGKSKIICEYSSWPDREAVLEPYELKTVVGIPFRQMGEVEAVLFLADSTGSCGFVEADLEILERFALQASLALQTSRLMSREQRRLAQLAVFHRISDYIQSTGDLDKILHVILTVVTAGYGLSFNRAVLFLLDEAGENLVDRMGIGHLEEKKAREDWARDEQRGVYDIGQYLELLEQEALPLTPVGERVSKLQLAVASAGSDVFSRVVQEQQRALVTQEELDKLPARFVEAFEPALPLVVIPLMARGQVIGLLVADNKFTRAPITDEDVDLLVTFANTAAIAIDNVRLLRETEVARERLRSFYEASNTLVLSQDLNQVLRDIVEQARVAADSMSVRVILIDEMGHARNLVTAGTDKRFEVASAIRPDGLSMQVMRTGKAEVVEDADRQRDRINPIMLQDGVAAALCLPLSLQGRRIGVMWVHYDAPRRFPEFEIDALQLYVNQAAIAYDSARRMQELEHLRQAAEKLASVAEVREILLQIVKSAREVLGADSAVIWSYDAVRDTFLPDELVADGIEPELVERFREDDPRPGGTADIVIQRRYLAVTNVDDPEYAYLGPTARGLRGAVGAKAFQGIALREGDETLGVLYVNYDQRRGFTDEDRTALETFAYHAALSLKKARLLEQVSKARDTARVVAEVTVLEDLESTLDSIVQGTQDALKCDAVTLYTYDEDRGKLGYPPTIIGVNYPKRVMRLSEVPKSSIIFEMLYRDEPYVVEDSTSDQLFEDRRFVTDEGIESCVAIPLKVGERKTGVMFINYRLLHRFTAAEIANIKLFAHQAAVAIRNAQLYDETIRRTKTLRTLYEAGKLVTSTLALDETLNHIVEQAWHLTGQYGKYARFSDLELVEGNRLRVKAAYPPKHLAEMQKLVGDIDLEHDERIGITGRAVRTGQCQLVNDITQESDYIEYDPETHSELAVPIKFGEEVIGVINVEHPDTFAFDQQDQRALEALAAQAAIAIRNARLLADISRRNVQLQTVAEVSGSTSTILDPERLMNQAVNLIQEGFGFYYVGLFLVDEASECAVLRAGTGEAGQEMLKEGHELAIGGQSMIGWSVANAQARVTLDVGKETVRFENPHLPETRSEMALPLISRGQCIGALTVQSTEEAAFSKGDIAVLQVMADQLTTAIANAQLYQQATGRLNESQALQRVATSLAGTLELEEVLHVVMAAAMDLTDTNSGSILFWDSQQEMFTHTLTTGPDRTLQSYHSRARLEDGIARAIIDEQKPVVIPDTREDLRVSPVALEKERRALIGVPLVSREQAIGVLYVSSSKSHRFSDLQVALLESLASQAAVAIERARQYEELKQTKGLVGARTALAWMGMASSAWRHAIDKHTLTIREQTQLLRGDWERALSDPQDAKVDNRIATIERLATRILEKPITPPLSTEDGLERVALSEMIGERARQLWQNTPFKEAALQLDLQLPESVTVQANPEWLRRAFDLLVDNAMEAVAGCKVQEIVVGTRAADGGAEIFVSDTGPGISEEIQAKIGLEWIEKPEDAGGLGMGLLMAQTIAQTYGGEIRVESTGPTGTTMVIWLPLEVYHKR